MKTLLLTFKEKNGNLSQTEEKRFFENIHVLPQSIYNTYCNKSNFIQDCFLNLFCQILLNILKNGIISEMMELIPKENERFFIPCYLDKKDY